MRTLTSHKVNGCNDSLEIMVTDQPGAGGACHCYRVEKVRETSEPANSKEGPLAVLHFQNGPLREAGVNGVTHEVLLAILEDRLLGFQSGKFACEANAEALKHVQAAQEILKKRTEERIVRGVEGTHKV